MDPEEKIPEIPYHTPERIEDPPGGISYYTPAVSPYTDEDEDKVSPYTDEVEDKGNNAATDDEYLTGQNKEYLLILNYLIVCNTHWSIRY